ncbi:MAG: hypothetical protein AAGA77_05480 [Bacteroidota bacterium]
MLRSITITLFTLFIHSSLNAQELLHTTDGDTLSISVVEFKDDLFVYKKIDSDNLLASKIKYLDKLIYSNGDVYLFKNKKYIKRRENKIYTTKMKALALQVGLLKYDYGLFMPSVSFSGCELNSASVLDQYAQLQNQKALRDFKTGRRLTILGNILAFPSGFLFGYALHREFDRPRFGKRRLLYSTAITGVASLFLNGLGHKLIKNSVENYNLDISLHLEATPNGFGMVLKF